MLLIKKVIKNKSVNSGSFHKLESNIGYLMFYKEKLKEKKQNLNCSNKLCWNETESCFNGRIRTGVISNLKYKDPKNFFQKAFRIFSNKIKFALKTCIIKVNCIFSANFILPTTNEIEIKTFVTGNSVIDYGTNIKKWYNDNIVENILQKLESRG